MILRTHHNVLKFTSPEKHMHGKSTTYSYLQYKAMHKIFSALVLSSFLLPLKRVAVSNSFLQLNERKSIAKLKVHFSPFLFISS